MVKRSMTGKFQFKTVTRLFKKPLLVLQVQCRDKGYYMDNGGGRVGGIDVDRLVWINATSEHLLLLDFKQENK